MHFFVVLVLLQDHSIRVLQQVGHDSNDFGQLDVPYHEMRSFQNFGIVVCELTPSDPSTR